MVLRRIFGPKREEVAGDWRRLHNEELHNLYASPNIVRVMKSRRMRQAENVARMKEIQNFGRKTQMEETTRKSRCRAEDNIRMDLREIGLECAD
jgi:hypothetical protein